MLYIYYMVDLTDKKADVCIYIYTTYMSTSYEYIMNYFNIFVFMTDVEFKILIKI